MRTIFIVTLFVLCNSLYSQSPDPPADFFNSKGLLFQQAANGNENKAWGFKSSMSARLDSIVEYNYGPDNDSVRYYKEDYSQYRGEKWSVFVSSFWDTTNFAWIPDFRMEYDFHSSGAYTRTGKFDWSREENKWIPREKYVSEYEDDGSPISNNLFKWDKDKGDWVNYWQSVYSYTDEDIRFDQIISNWSIELNEWIPDYKYEYQYYTKELLNSYERYKWSVESSEWLPHGKTQYQYDDNGYVIQIFIWAWMEERNDWVNSLKYDREYDHFGNIISNIGSAWDLASEQWVFSTKTVKDFDSNNNIILDEYYNNSSEILPTSRSTYEYDNNGYVISHYYYLRDFRTQEMEYRYRDLYFYNDDKSVSVKRRSYFDENLEQWIFEFSESWYYTYLSGIHNEPLSSVNIFPNPTSGIINIGGLQQPATVEIISIQGKKMKSFSMVQSNIDVSDLKPGMYLMSLTSGSGLLITRILVK